MTAPLIALVGSDGSGKSTVGEALIAWLKQRGPAELCHLGKQSGNLGRALSGLPLVGGGMKKTIDSRVSKAEGQRGPGLVESLVIYSFTLRRVRRFERMLALREQGVTILADRFPQTELPAAIDGPGFGRVGTDHPVARRLAAKELRQFEWMTRHHPDLVIKLIVDLDTALARKSDHSPAILARRVAEVPQLTFPGSTVVSIDATRPVEEVIAAAKDAISAMLARS